MFNENEIKAYKSIKAPESLKERVLADNKVTPHKKPAYKRIATLAASIVLIVSVCVAGFKISTPEIYTGGMEYNGGEVYLYAGNIALARQTGRSFNSITIESVLPVDISIDNGSFSVRCGNTEEIIQSVKKYSGKGNIIIIVNLNEGETAVLTVSNSIYNEKIELIAE